MTAPLSPTASDGDLAEAHFANLHDLFRAMCRLPGSEIEEGPSFSRHLAPPANPMFKGMWGAPADGSSAPLVAEGVAWFRSRQAPMAFWWTEGTPSPGLLGALSAEGLVPFETGAPVMGARIEDLRWGAPRPADLRVELVEDRAALDEWSRMFVESFDIPAFAAQAWVDATLAFGIDAAPWRMMVGRIAERPVASAMLFCSAGVAGLIQMGVVPAARRRGVGSAMQLERLRLARELGYRHAVLSAAAMGVSPYRKLGFRDTGARVSRYLWRAADAGDELGGGTWRDGN